MRSLLIMGILIVLTGSSMTVFGAVYSTTSHLGIISEGVNGTTSFQPIVVSYYLYPLWSPPQYPNQTPPNTITKCALQAAGQRWYTPLNPPPSCLVPPVTSSANYMLNILGVVLIGLGIVVVGTSVLHRPRLTAIMAHRLDRISKHYPTSLVALLDLIV